MNNVIVGGDGWVYYETVGGGQGGRPGRAGMSGVHTGMTNTDLARFRSAARAGRGFMGGNKAMHFPVRGGGGGGSRWERPETACDGGAGGEAGPRG